MTEIQENLSKMQVWMLAIRPKTLPAAGAGVIVGTALAFYDGYFQLLPALAALIGALLLQIGSNLANDVFDYLRGAESKERLGPIRVTQAGLLSPKEVQKGMWITFFLAALIGIYLITIAGWAILLIGLTAILAAIAYTGPISDKGGLADIFVFLYFGVAAVVGTYYVQALKTSPAAWWMSVPIGLLIVNILVVNNLRDIEADKAVGKITTAVRMGVSATRKEYLLLLTASYLILPVLIAIKLIPLWALLVWLSIPFAKKVTETIFDQLGHPLNQALAGTGKIALIYSLLFFAGLFLASYL
ncbi:MAG: 1,4-dihydroxy-2-naphthoate polyprenyltransferase [Anaerolineae bacterium]|jgi:1,4-dihydroxy-2-naphthoate polyprenyltransferase|nr:1,4-dihydroxy-2-naphthoate polyprenyltransferase [Anaerolineae bacterium]MBT7075961.1 1,4-dihydroxy-2-naphthoate polyprenyltransferase [Anaerolineae bacterium]MBT7783639.1 1,4-dihydroxy-2-naphthoate polyprenyltransferase [Anaerolineae bacterium]